MDDGVGILPQRRQDLLRPFPDEREVRAGSMHGEATLEGR